MMSEFQTNANRAKNDFYATRHEDVEKIIKEFPDVFAKSQEIWECAVGMGHISSVIKQHFPNVNIFKTDIEDYGINDVTGDFLKMNYKDKFDMIITNPPYKYATQFVIHALEQVKNNGYVIMFLRTLFIEGQERFDKIFSQYPPKVVNVYIKRTYGLINGDKNNKTSSAMSHSWIVWQKGNNEPTILNWI